MRMPSRTRAIPWASRVADTSFTQALRSLHELVRGIAAIDRDTTVRASGVHQWSIASTSRSSLRRRNAERIAGAFVRCSRTVRVEQVARGSTRRRIPYAACAPLNAHRTAMTAPERLAE
jgi:hypothetical protein